MRTDETLMGRPGSGGRPLLALHLAQNHPLADPPACRLSEGRNIQRCPLLGGLRPPLVYRCPPALQRRSCSRRVGPLGGLAM
jgi:hypothetical protein